VPNGYASVVDKMSTSNNEGSVLLKSEGSTTAIPLRFTSLKSIVEVKDEAGTLF